MAKGLNKVMLIGNLGGDPELRYTTSGQPVANFSVATSESYRDNNENLVERTEWHKIVVWGKLAEICKQYLKKGEKVYIEGKLQTRSWEDQDSRKHYTTEIVCSDMQMLGSRREGGMNGNGGNGASYGEDVPPMDVEPRPKPKAVTASSAPVSAPKPKPEFKSEPKNDAPVAAEPKKDDLPF